MKGSVSSTLGLITHIGSTVLPAVQAYYEIQERSKAKVLFNVNNLSVWPLDNTQIQVVAGESTNVSHTVLPGYSEGIAVNQDGTSDLFTEGYIAFDAAPGFYCLFYWYIEGLDNAQPQGHSLGVGCKPTNQSIENFHVDVDLDTLPDSFITLGDFADENQDSIHYCAEDLCVFAIATPSHQVEVDIDIIPRHVENLAPTLVDDSAGGNDISQLQLDNILHEHTCKTECDFERDITTESHKIDSIFNLNKLYKLSSKKDRAGFVMLIVLFLGIPLSLTIIPCARECKKKK